MVAVWVAEVSYSRSGDSSRWPSAQRQEESSRVSSAAVQGVGCGAPESQLNRFYPAH